MAPNGKKKHGLPHGRYWNNHASRYTMSKFQSRFPKPSTKQHTNRHVMMNFYVDQGRSREIWISNTSGLKSSCCPTPMLSRIQNNIMPRIYPNLFLVGGWTNSFEKYARQNGSSSPNGGVKNKKCFSLSRFHALLQPAEKAQTGLTKIPLHPREL